MHHPQQVQFFPDSSLPLGQGDLEALERLKEVIKSNQHEIFRAIPRPAALASLYKGHLPSSIPPHLEQIPSNPKEEPTTTPSSPSFEAPSSSTFISGAHSAHVVSAQGATRPSISSDILPSNTVNLQDQGHILTNANGHLTSQQNADDSLHPTTSQLRDASAEQVIDSNGSSVPVSLHSSPPPRPLRDSTFSPRGPLRRDIPTDTHRMQPQLLPSPDGRNPRADINTSARPSVYASGRDQPTLREMWSYDHDRSPNRVHETNEQDRMRERRWSLTDHRRYDHDRRSSDNDRRFPLDGRRRPSYDRRPPHIDDDRHPPQNNDRRPHFEDKHHPSSVDRRMLDDRRFPDYEHRPISEEIHSGNAPSQDRPQEAFIGNEKHVGPVQTMKTRVPFLSTVSAPNVAAVTMAPDSVDPAAEGAMASDHRPSVNSSVPVNIDDQGISTSSFAAPLEERSNQMASLHERISSTYSQLGSRAESTRPGPFEERPTEPLVNPGATPSSLLGSNGPVDDLLHTRVSESSHATSSRPGLDDDQQHYSIPTEDNQTRPVSIAYPALSGARDETMPRPPPPPLSASTPSALSSTQPSPSLRAREPLRERTPNYRPYFRSEFSRPLEDTRSPDAHSSQTGNSVRRWSPPPYRNSDAHSSQSGNSLRRYHERGRWSPPPYGDRRGYRDYYDRDRPYWDNKDRARVLPTPPEPMPPSYWDRERTRYPEPSYTGASLDRRFEDRNQGNRDGWYPPSYDNTSRRQFDKFARRGRPRSPGSPSREPTGLRPPPTKRVRDDAVGGHSATGNDYYGTNHPHHPPPAPSAPTLSMNKEPLPPRPPPGPLPSAPIPTTRPTPLPPPQPRYSHNRTSEYETYGGPYGGYERDGGHGLAGSSYPREGPR